MAQLKASPRNYCDARGAEHAAAHDLSRGRAQSAPVAAVATPAAAITETEASAGRIERAALMANHVHVQADPPACSRPRSSRRATTSRRVTETVAQIPLSKRTPLGWVFGFLIGFALLNGLMVALAWLLLKGVGIWGNNIPVGWAFADHQLRLVDRHRPRRHADLRDPAALQAAVAHVDQPLRRSDDDLRGHVRRDLPGLPHRPSVARGVLAVPVSQHDGPVAAVPQPAHLGRLRGLDLRHGVGGVLVRRPDPRLRDDAGSRGVEGQAGHLRQSCASAGAAPRATGTATRWRR